MFPSPHPNRDGETRASQEQKGRLLDAPHIQGVVFLVEGHGPLFGVEDGFQSERCGWADGTNPEGFTEPLPKRRLGLARTHHVFLEKGSRQQFLDILNEVVGVVISKG